MKTQHSNSFDDWAMRNGYIMEWFSGDVQIPAANTKTLIEVSVPAGQTWYRRQAFYTCTGGRNAVFRAYRSDTDGIERYVNKLPIRPFEEKTLDVRAKYPAGAKFRVSIDLDALAVAGDLVTARIVWITLPWEE
ncbi:MAG: hypothetical protein M3R38_01835 [Actinomycetota bacterium]|nr:hypothetical protein [Actinomycetota bacterium]